MSTSTPTRRRPPSTSRRLLRLLYTLVVVNSALSIAEDHIHNTSPWLPIVITIRIHVVGAAFLTAVLAYLAVSAERNTAQAAVQRARDLVDTWTQREPGLTRDARYFREALGAQLTATLDGTTPRG